jgi:hypothetical protein
MRGNQEFVFVPCTGQTNDAGMHACNREDCDGQVTSWIAERKA